MERKQTVITQNSWLEAKMPISFECCVSAGPTDGHLNHETECVPKKIRILKVCSFMLMFDVFYSLWFYSHV